MGLHVIIVGAGVAGLTAATALCQTGHEVEVLEKSRFKTEVGAALNLMPNGANTLSKLGFGFDRALVGRHLLLQTVNGVSLEQLTAIDLGEVKAEYGADMQSILRADLHSELLRLAQQGSNPAKLRLGCAVENVDATQGRVTLESGEILTSDLVIAADGAHSVCREEVLGRQKVPRDSGMNAFRFLIPTEKIPDIDDIRALVPGSVRGTTLFADTNDKQKTRHIAWYDCHGGSLQNLVGIYPSDQHDATLDNKTMLLQQFQHFHPKVLGLLHLADDVRVWPLRYDDPFERYTKGRLVLIGDAAHTMLPFSGQGANQAIEGAGLLGELFQNVDAEAVPAKVHEYERLRTTRITLLKLLSRIRFGTENDPAYASIEHPLLHPHDVPRTFEERLRYEWGAKAVRNVPEECVTDTKPVKSMSFFSQAYLGIRGLCFL